MQPGGQTQCDICPGSQLIVCQTPQSSKLDLSFETMKGDSDGRRNHTVTQSQSTVPDPGLFSKSVLCQMDENSEKYPKKWRKSAEFRRKMPTKRRNTRFLRGPDSKKPTFAVYSFSSPDLCGSTRAGTRMLQSHFEPNRAKTRGETAKSSKNKAVPTKKGTLGVQSRLWKRLFSGRRTGTRQCRWIKKVHSPNLKEIGRIPAEKRCKIAKSRRKCTHGPVD